MNQHELDEAEYWQSRIDEALYELREDIKATIDKRLVLTGDLREHLFLIVDGEVE